jgi:hypothetical protein
VAPSIASRGRLCCAAAQDMSVRRGGAIGSCLGMLGEVAESQRFALALLGSAPVHSGAVASEDRGPL